MNRNFDVIIVGSGLSGVHAAYPLVEAGRSVALIDVGHARAGVDADMRTFETIRTHDPDQYKIFLGSDFSGIDLGAGHGRAMVSGRRSFVTEGADVYAPLAKADTWIIQSFARGGLSSVWSGVSEVFDRQELEAVGLPADEMQQHYEVIARRIGISGHAPGLPLQEAPKLDDASKELLQRYRSREDRIKQKGYSIGQPLYAMLTQAKDGRAGQAYRDMDFWDDTGRAIYRAEYSLEALERRENFTYIPGMLVERVEDSSQEVSIIARDIKSGVSERFAAQRVVLAAGALNTTRLLLRSFERYDTPAPIILKNHYTMPCLFLSRLGKRPDPSRHSVSQLAMYSLARSDGMGSSYAQLLTYNSLLLYKLLSSIPLPVPEAFAVASILAPALMFADFRFPSRGDDKHHAILKKDGSKGVMHINYPEDPATNRAQADGIRAAQSALRALGLYPLTTVRYPYGATSHYAGGIPFEEHASDKLSVDRNGRVHGHERIFIADSASWRALPGKPSGFTIMANANRVGGGVLRALS